MRNLAGHYQSNGGYFSRTNIRNELQRQKLSNFGSLSENNLSKHRHEMLDSEESINDVRRLEGVNALGHTSHENDAEQLINEMQYISLHATNQNGDVNSHSTNRNQDDIQHSTNQKQGALNSHLTKIDRKLPKQSIANHHHSNVTINQNQSHIGRKMSPQKLPNVLPRVLLAADISSTFTAKTIAGLLESQRIEFDFYFQTANKTPHALWIQNGEDKIIGKYSLMIFANYAGVFYTWPKVTRATFLDYSETFGVTMVGVARTPKNISQPGPGYFNNSHFVLDDVITHTVTTERVKFLELSSKRDFYMLNNGGRIFELPAGIQWHAFLPIKSLDVGHVTDTMETKHSNTTKTRTKSTTNENSNVLATITYKNEAAFNSAKTVTSPLVLVMKGLNSGARKVLIGSPVTFWLTKMMLFEILKEESRMSLMRYGRERSVMVDIDDIFVAPEGRKMNVSDVQVCVCVMV